LAAANDKKNTFFQKQTGEVAENKGSAQKTNRNKPENKAEKLLKTRACGKNKPETNRKQTGELTGNAIGRKGRMQGERACAMARSAGLLGLSCCRSANRYFRVKQVWRLEMQMIDTRKPARLL
ncbi:MAG TPA: hypothetical protein VFZ27_03720, partial [Terriglobia bacterium]|nr:hypothetical protein [Terriglobia bacterium]